MEEHGEVGGDCCHEGLARAPFAGEFGAVDRVLRWLLGVVLGGKGGVWVVLTGLTTRTKTLLSVAQTSTNTPAPRTMVAATFFNSLSWDPQSIGMGRKIRYRSVTMLEAKVTQTIAREMAG